jgi:hypothetical protein
MLSTYQAILRGEVVEWLADKPDNLTPDRAVAVYVTILEEAPPLLLMTERGLRMAAALEQLAQMQGAIASLDPLQWERELRQERELPGRENDAD